jgi:hypothetical protein
VDAAEKLDGIARAPLPGDAVRLTGEYSLVKSGSYGFIEGFVGVEQDEYLVCFNVSPAPFKGRASFGTLLETAIVTGAKAGATGEVVSCSGGPALYLPVKYLRPTDEVKEFTFWKWDGLPRAGGGANYRQAVPVWEWEGEHDY